jgi:hypothetical protein
MSEYGIPYFFNLCHGWRFIWLELTWLVPYLVEALLGWSFTWLVPYLVEALFG